MDRTKEKHNVRSINIVRGRTEIVTKHYAQIPCPKIPVIQICVTIWECATIILAGKLKYQPNANCKSNADSKLENAILSTIYVVSLCGEKISLFA
jgi:hypothetical protein